MGQGEQGDDCGYRVGQVEIESALQWKGNWFSDEVALGYSEKQKARENESWR